MNALLRHKRLTVRTDLQDNHLYIFNRAVLEVLQSKPSLANIKQVLALRLLHHITRCKKSFSQFLFRKLFEQGWIRDG